MRIRIATSTRDWRRIGGFNERVVRATVTLNHKTVNAIRGERQELNLDRSKGDGGCWYLPWRSVMVEGGGKEWEAREWEGRERYRVVWRRLLTAARVMLSQGGLTRDLGCSGSLQGHSLGQTKVPKKIGQVLHYYGPPLDGWCPF